jgi:hypothetical protein
MNSDHRLTGKDSDTWQSRLVARPLYFSHIGNEPDAFASKGPYQPLVPAIVAYRRAQGANPAVHSGIGDDASLPHRLDEFVSAEYTIPVANEIKQKIKDLGFDINDNAVSAQFTLPNMQNTRFEAVHQLTLPRRPNGEWARSQE